MVKLRSVLTMTVELMCFVHFLGSRSGVTDFKRCKCEAGLLTFTCELSEGTGVWIKKFLQWNKHNYRSSKSLELKFQQPISCSEYLIVGKYV